MGKKTALIALTLSMVFGLVTMAAGAEESRRTLNLKLGGSEMIKTTHPVKRASVANPEIADVIVLSPKEFYTFGKKVGYTSMILWQDGSDMTLLDVVVSLDLTGLKEQLAQLYPNQDVEVRASETGVVLSGTVSGPEVMEQILRLTRTYLPVEAKGDKEGSEGSGESGFGITNLMKIAGIQQVLLEVKFAEVTRGSDKDWQAALGFTGLNDGFTGAIGTGLLNVTPSGDIDQGPGSLLMNFAPNNLLGKTAANIFVDVNNVTAALNFLEQEGLSRTLAEPRLITQSGQEASFLAGGEFPVPISQEVGAFTVEFKDFGVGLRFTPVVLSNGLIDLRVAPSVSEISATSTIPSGVLGVDYIVPNLSTRKLETSVQLRDGQTLALAGLLQDSLREEVKKVPGLGDIPILGALFRSTSYRQQKTDLLIAVTPHLVKPVKEGEITFPGEFMTVPDAYQFYLENKLEGTRDEETNLMGHDFAATKAIPDTEGGLEGDFGHEQPE